MLNLLTTEYETKRKIIIIIIIIFSICIALYKEHSAFYTTDTVDIRQCNYVAAANQRQLRHSNTQNRTYGLGNRWLSHSSFAQFSNEPSG